MHSFPTTSPEGFPTLEWYLDDGTLAATSVCPPTDEGTEIWDHFSEDGQTVGRSLKVGTGYGHYSPEGGLIEETTDLAGFWGLCDLKRIPGAHPSPAREPVRQALSPSAKAPGRESSRSVPPPVARPWTPALALAVLVAFLGVASGFVILAAPDSTVHRVTGAWPRGEKYIAASNQGAPPARPPVPVGRSVHEEPPGPGRVRTEPPPPPASPSSPAPVPAPVSEPVPAGVSRDERTAILACLRAEHAAPGGEDVRALHLAFSGPWACTVSHGVDASGRPCTGPFSNLLRKDEQGAWKIVSYIKSWQPPRDSDIEVDEAMDFSRADTQQGILRQHPDFPAGIFPRPMGPVVPTNEVIRTLTRDLLELEHARNLPALMGCYAPEVSSQEKAPVPRDTLRHQKQLAFQLWPAARFEVVGEIEVTEVEPGVWQSMLVATFELENARAESTTGRRRMELTYRLQHDRYRVTAERWELLPATDDKEAIRQFVIRNRELENRQALDQLMPAYGEQVDYFDKGNLLREEVRQDKERYFERWPVAIQTITSPVEVESLGEGRYQVTYDTQFQVRHPVEGRSREGVCQCVMVIVSGPSGPQIVMERAPVHPTRSVPAPLPSGGPARSGGGGTSRQRPPEGGTPRKETFEEMTRRLNKL